MNVCVLYIAKFDIFGTGRPVYHVKRIVEETGEIVYNGFEEIYINAEARDGSDISELMQVFTEGAAYSEKFPVTSELKRLYREGDETMIRTLSDVLREEGFKKGWEDGLAEGKVEGKAEGTQEVIRILSQKLNLTEAELQAMLD